MVIVFYYWLTITYIRIWVLSVWNRYFHLVFLYFLWLSYILHIKLCSYRFSYLVLQTRFFNKVLNFVLNNVFWLVKDTNKTEMESYTAILDKPIILTSEIQGVFNNTDITAQRWKAGTGIRYRHDSIVTWSYESEWAAMRLRKCYIKAEQCPAWWLLIHCLAVRFFLLKVCSLQKEPWRLLPNGATWPL